MLIVYGGSQGTQKLINNEYWDFFNHGSQRTLQRYILQNDFMISVNNLLEMFESASLFYLSFCQGSASEFAILTVFRILLVLFKSDIIAG